MLNARSKSLPLSDSLKVVGVDLGHRIAHFQCPRVPGLLLSEVAERVAGQRDVAGLKCVGAVLQGVIGDGELMLGPEIGHVFS
ncbi:hypothetical protein [Nocardiopsis salina]|uniref:hypothetical protein n=1 Tax=Nocardiopsis salina TaxID=245836 RepID=UPI00037220BB|nr:hypothetical protein [Nocardiopsis salina]